MALGLDTSAFTVSTVGADASAMDIGAVLRLRAQTTPDQVAFRFLADGEDEAIEWTYSQLDRHADRVAADLRSQLAPGARVLLVLEPGLKYIAALFGIFKAGATAVPSFPPTGSRAVSRLASICSDCKAQLIIAEPGLRNSVERINTALSSGGHVPEWMFIDEAYFSGAAADSATAPGLPAANQADIPALLQYTSGSTGNPKGVVLSHANLMSNSRVLDDRLGPGQAHTGFTWLPPYHDMGLMGALLLSVYSGFTLVVMTPAHFVQRPLRWLKGLSDHKVTTSVGPNFALDLCVDSISDDEIAQLDLSHLKLLFCGAEPVRQATLDRFSEKFKPAGFSPAAFVPCYGLAEATLFISGKPDPAVPALSLSLDKAALEAGRALPAAADGQDDGQATVVASCGTVALGHSVAIVDPETRERLADNAVGEIWFKGASVALGYFNQAPASADVFKASIAGTPDDGPYLRTGDLGFMRDGELYVTGRIKDVIIFAGRNLYPQDIEATVQACHSAVRTNGVAAFSVTRDNAEQLVIVAEIQRTARLSATGLQEVAAAITSAVTQSHGVAPYAVHLAPVSTIPLTTSGKVRRSACRDAFNDNQLALARPRAAEAAAADSALAAA